MSVLVRVVTRWPRLHRVFHRPGDWNACVVCRLVWTDALARPSFREALNAGLADIAAGRTVLYEVRNGELVRASDGRPLA